MNERQQNDSQPDPVREPPTDLVPSTPIATEFADLSDDELDLVTGSSQMFDML